MKIILSLVSIISFVFSCNNGNVKSSNTNSKNEELVTQYFEYFNKHNWEKLSTMYTAKADFKDPAFGKNTRTLTQKEITKKYEDLNSMVLDIHDSVVNIYSSGSNNVIVEFISSGTTLDKTKFTLPICTIFTIENGKITKDFTYYDNF